MKKGRILTGDRTTGKLHLGHYFGSLQNRVKLQYEYETFIILADVQALTTHFENPAMLSESLRNVAIDYLSVGIDPEISTIFVQSLIPEIAELTIYYSMFVSVNSLRHNPTIKTEAKERGYNDLTYGFLGYPVSQAADISFCKANLVPVGEDQVPHIEMCRKIVRRFNELYKPVLVEPQALVGEVPRLVGLDGKLKMSKSYGNAIYLSESFDDIMKKVRNAVTDPNRIKKTDPGNPDICTVFSYQGIFNKNEKENIEEMCKNGKIGCVECKKILATKINELITPFREKRAYYEAHPKLVDEILIEGTNKARKVAKETMGEVREAMKINYFE
ncbi:MAG: tryptophan--tRNA ligase [Caloramator sp.]|nr:tryptophan--tRNA ligase [Caloramator sp.]